MCCLEHFYTRYCLSDLALLNWIRFTGMNTLLWPEVQTLERILDTSINASTTPTPAEYPIRASAVAKLNGRAPTTSSDQGTTHCCSYRVQGGMSFAKATCERENKWEGDSQYRLGATYGSVPQAHRKYGIKNKTKQKHYCTDSTRCLLLAIIPFPLSFPYTDPERTTLICLLTSDSLFTTCLTTWFWYNVIT